MHLGAEDILLFREALQSLRKHAVKNLRVPAIQFPLRIRLRLQNTHQRIRDILGQLQILVNPVFYYLTTPAYLNVIVF